MTTIHIVAGPVCALKSSWAQRAFPGTPVISADAIFDDLASEPALLQNNYLYFHFEDIFIEAAVTALSFHPADLVIDGTSMSADPYAYNFTTADGVYRFIDFIDSAATKLPLPPYTFIIHWLTIPRAYCQILNHRRAHPYPSERFRDILYFNTNLLGMNATLSTHDIDAVFDDLSINLP